MTAGYFIVMGKSYDIIGIDKLEFVEELDKLEFYKEKNY